MKPVPGFSSRASFLCLLPAVLMLPWTTAAQNPPRQLVTQAIDESKTVTLRGTVHPLARAGSDQGAVPDSFAANRMLLMLNRPPEREAALRQFLSDVHSPGTASYHQWLTPAQYGEQFGPADSDVQAAANWLASHGFRVAATRNGKSLIEFSGTAANVREAFHSEIHQYSIKGETRYANATELTIPEALAPLVRGVAPISNFRLKPYVQSLGQAWYSRSANKATPLFTLPGGISNFFALAPEDFATQYDVTPLYAAGVNGSGQTIGIIGESNIDVSLVNTYRQLFGLPANPTQIVIDGNDPGIEPLPSSDLEAYLDVELSGAVAPNATVNLYISDGSQIEDPIMLSAARAVEDNQASVLSLSFGGCEAQLGANNNFLWNRLWEEAAAQGQTVVVSTGDSGSGGCDFDGSPVATQGLAVNGTASTPWNVAVGGTDFFYPGYASGPSSATPFWNQTNDASNGSLKASLPEQPWDGPFGLNIFSGLGSSILGGGGGASSCSQSAGQTVCLSGYPKPIWQTAPGVPNDGVRDLPDVSLFAAAGENSSAYAICAAQGNCSTPSGGQPQILLVGGTSASAPAMAGLMALVNQRFGRQGQADFTLYALARQFPAVFHDITTGTNNVPCQQGSPDCSLDTNGDGLFSLQKYPAGPGYDLASGLGSVDANALVTNWNKTSFLSTTTTLSLSPTSFVHGTLVNFTANVAGSSGSGTPTGDVGITTTSGMPFQWNESIPLASGTASEQVGFFPGGTYQVSARYYGDGNFGPSASAPVNVTVTPESSSIWFVAYGPQGNVINTGDQGTYGGRWIFTAEPYGMNGEGLFGLGTGSVTFADGTNSQKVPINSQGVAGYSPTTLSVGTHAITLSYSGDVSYQPSAVGPFTFTIAKGDPQLYFPQLETSVPVGGNLTMDVVLGTGFGTPPTGNVSVTLGGTTVTAPLVAVNNFAGFPHAVATATLANLPTAGTFTLSVNYAGDNNWIAAAGSYPTPIVVTPSTRAASTITLSVSPTSITRTQSTSFTATVQGSSGTPPAPTGSVIFYVNGYGLPGSLVQIGPGTSIGTPSGPMPALALSSGGNQVVAVYSGDSVYNPSTSAPGAVTVDLSTFSLSLDVPRVVIPSGQSGSVSLILNGADGFNMAVPVTCVPSPGSIGCTVNPSTPMVSGITTASLTINAYALQGAESLPLRREGLPQFPAGVAVVFALSIFFALRSAPIRTRARLQWALGLGTLSLLLLINGCGGGSGNVGPPPPPPPAKIPAPAGTYSVLVSATANGTTHNAKLIVIVQ